MAPEDKAEMCLALVNSPYELNEMIPNIELLLFKIFTSPMYNKAARKAGDSDDLLVGNLFRGVNFKPSVYRSLLETVALQPKKKHFKKIMEHLIESQYNENSSQVPGDIIDLAVSIGIEQKYPVYIGQSLKTMLQSYDKFDITTSTFKTFVLFLERCKGYEADATRFMALANDTEHIQIDYELMQPIFLRTIKHKNADEVLKLFEQFRKALKLNKAGTKLETNARNQKLRDIKYSFYDGLVSDLMANSAYSLSQVIQSEKSREKFDAHIGDDLIALEIFANQRKMAEFQEIFKPLLTDKNRGEGYKLTTPILEQMCTSLMKFNTDDAKSARLEMTTSILDVMQENYISFTSILLHNMMFIFTESQQWSKINNLIQGMNHRNCTDPDRKTITFLKRNLVYCFDASLRSSIKDNIEQFEGIFFKRAKDPLLVAAEEKAQKKQED